MSPLLIWTSTALLYGLFWLWYVGLKRKITSPEIESTLARIQQNNDVSEQLIATLRNFFAQDDGRDFVMINLLELKEPADESRQKLEAYQRVFLGSLLKRAGHPVFIARVAGGKIENIGCDRDNWGAAGMVRYRSRRDLMELLPETIGSDHHALKWEALERTFAYPAAPWFIAGGPKLVVPLILALVAATGHIALLSWSGA